MPTATHPITEPLDLDTIAERIAALRGGDSLMPEAAPDYRYYQPFEEAAEEYVQFSRTADRRIYTGITEFDGAMRGVAPKEMCLVTGHAHSGKTVFITNVLQANATKRIAVFTPDETRVLVLVKLACAAEGVSAEYLESQLARGDEWAEEVLRRTARDLFPHLAVFDSINSLDVMSHALDECVRAWGAQPEAVVIDYAELVNAGTDDTAGKINAIKDRGKQWDVPLFLLHQTSRSAGADGKKLTISSGSYGGEQQANFLVGVRRKRTQFQAIIDDLTYRIDTGTRDLDKLQHALAEAKYELERHRNTVTFSLLKNKRPPSQLVEDTDFLLDPDTGRVNRLGGSSGVPLSVAAFTQDEAF